MQILLIKISFLNQCNPFLKFHELSEILIALGDNYFAVKQGKHTILFKIKDDKIYSLKIARMDGWINSLYKVTN